jgi:predicted TIM-barrel fold metal-dependent hydrolase
MFFSKRIMINETIAFVDNHMHGTVTEDYIPGKDIVNFLKSRGLHDANEFLARFISGERDISSRFEDFRKLIGFQPEDIINYEKFIIDLIANGKFPVNIPCNSQSDRLFNEHPNQFSYDHVRGCLIVAGQLTAELVEKLKQCYVVEEYRKIIDDSVNFALQFVLENPLPNDLVDRSAFVTLAMNFDHAGFDTPLEETQNTYAAQFDKILELRNYFGEQHVLPTDAIDPRIDAIDLSTSNLIQEVESAVRHGVYIFKMYPSLGYAVDDPRLFPFYEFANSNPNIKIIAHSGVGGFENPLLSKIPQVWNIDHYEDMQFRDILPWNWFAPEKTPWFNHQKKWAPVLAQFPKMHVILAHFGGSEHLIPYAAALIAGKPAPKDNCTDETINFCEKYENVASDFSYTGSDSNAHQCIAAILMQKPFMKNKLCFGSDLDLVALAEPPYEYFMRAFSFWRQNTVQNQYLDKYPILKGFRPIDYYDNLFRNNAARWLNGESLNP